MRREAARSDACAPLPPPFRQLREYDVGAGYSHATLKEQPVPGYDPSLYQTRRIEVAARDGEAVPVTLLWRSDAVEEGRPAPCHLYGYGSYGVRLRPRSSPPRARPGSATA